MSTGYEPVEVLLLQPAILRIIRSIVEKIKISSYSLGSFILVNYEAMSA